MRFGLQTLVGGRSAEAASLARGEPILGGSTAPSLAQWARNTAPTNLLKRLVVT
ncbi:hypothetical protein GCM10011352_40740 [Marinobacterium zhoushanense]|uniref:Uncharacterized protein n=1 Tax=Marinobacterium zhoushanense TaxID=1679163 RepID=A0ABQ1KY95_9GAMM|nr:hypothetical protein GCM10011352_40740 [Marinobacterium zhoushanense]